MAKTFTMIKKKNLLTGEEKTTSYCLLQDEAGKEKLLKKLKNNLQGTEKAIIQYRMDERLYMHLLPGLSESSVKELSKILFHTAYVVCKKKKDSEEVLYLSLFKDSALRFKASLPKAMIKIDGKDFINPAYYIREITLFL